MYIVTLALLEANHHCNYVICPDTFGRFYLSYHQIQVLKENPIQAHIAEIDLSLLEAPSDKDESSYLGSGMFGSCQKMCCRGTPVAVKSFSSATSEDVKREAMIMM